MPTHSRSCRRCRRPRSARCSRYPLSRTQFTIIAAIACILVVGIVMKNAIMMVDFALDGERRMGLPAAEAIRQAARLRFRPIVMTTLAALLSALPLALGTGLGLRTAAATRHSDGRRPVPVAVRHALHYTCGVSGDRYVALRGGQETMNVRHDKLAPSRISQDGISDRVVQIEKPTDAAVIIVESSRDDDQPE